MSKIEVNHLKEMLPYRLRQLENGLDASRTNGADEIARALRQYRAIVLRAYTQSLKEGYGGAAEETPEYDTARYRK